MVDYENLQATISSLFRTLQPIWAFAGRFGGSNGPLRDDLTSLNESKKESLELILLMSRQAREIDDAQLILEIDELKILYQTKIKEVFSILIDRAKTNIGTLPQFNKQKASYSYMIYDFEDKLKKIQKMVKGKLTRSKPSQNRWWQFGK